MPDLSHEAPGLWRHRSGTLTHRVMAYDTLRRLFSSCSNVAVNGFSKELSVFLWVLPARPTTNHSPWNCGDPGSAEPTAA